MYPLGHFAVAYFLLLFLRPLIKEDYSLPIVLAVSVLPDMDILLSEYMVHRGPTHSVITMTVLFVPLILYFRRGIPYYIALLSHSIIGDYFTAYGIQLFWPLTLGWYRAPGSLILTGVRLTNIEYALSALMVVHFGYTRMRMHRA